jgi:type IX secretion system PorP/SprF family membrane protein
MNKLHEILRRALPIVLIAVFFICGKKVHAQQEILTTQWAYNKLTVNPAYAGAKEMFSARVLHRQQWVGLDGRPITSVINAHTPLLNNRIGLGISYVNDRLGVMNTNYLSMSYAYKLPFEKGTTLSMGFNVGFEALKIRSTELEAINNTDPILQQDLQKINFKTGAGVYYYGDKFYVGVSTPNVVPHNLINKSDIGELNTDAGKEAKQSIHIYAMAGYAIELADKDFVIKPQVLFKSVVAGDRRAPWQVDVNLSLELWETLIVGSTFRTTIANKNDTSLENIASTDIMMGFLIGKKFLASYAYDFTIGGIKSHDSGSHEILLGLDMDFKKKGAFSPRYF